jgi:glycine/D-amino acid oxidase-like deaminating enzyme
MPNGPNRHSKSSSGTRQKPARTPRPEVLVIGSGAVGAACASALARRGVRVRVISHPSRSTTSISGGHLLLQSKRPGATLELARRSLALLQEFVAGREEELRYRQSGSLLLATSDTETAALRAHWEALGAASVACEWLDGTTARILEPTLAPGVQAATYCPDDAQIDPAALAGAWLHDALAHGASLSSGVMVEGFVTSRGAVAGVVAGQAEYPASAVVLAAGPWSGELAAMAGAVTEIVPRRGLLLRGHSDRVLTGRPLLGASYLAAKFDDPAAGTQMQASFSFQQHPDGECVLGGTRDFAGFETGDLSVASAAILDCAAAYLPTVREVDWTQQDVGFRPWTPSSQPYLGATSVPGLFLACGHEGDGITLAAVTAERIAEAICGE